MTEYKRLKLMAEVQCWAIWNMDAAGNIDSATLPLSQDLIEAIGVWEDRFDAIYKLDDPDFVSKIKFESPEEENRFYDDGWVLLERLKQELPSVEWFYRDMRHEGVLKEKPGA